jgi:hypothetical protein
MEQQIKLTDKEEAMLKLIGNNALDGMGGSSYADLHEDNYSWFQASDLIKETGWSKESVGGVMGSLTEKGLICEDIGGEKYKGKNLWSLTDTGIDALIEL